MKKPDNTNKISSFAQKVYDAARLIPSGKVTTYGKLAKKIGVGGGSRAVGRALHANPFAPEVPCHRIVKSDGSLGGFASGVGNKIAILTKEGVIIDNGRINLDRFGI